MVLSADQLERIMQGEVRQECLDQGLKMLQQRLHSRAELSRKLARKQYPPGVVDDVLGDLERLGYVDDARFARTRALAAAQHKHHGRRRAMVELLKRGVEGPTAQRALEDVYEAHDSMATARALALKQAPRLRRLDSQTARRRLFGMLARRGFAYDEVRPVVDEVLGTVDDSPADS
jgi:regulatory protein